MPIKFAFVKNLYFLVEKAESIGWFGRVTKTKLFSGLHTSLPTANVLQTHCHTCLHIAQASILNNWLDKKTQDFSLIITRLKDSIQYMYKKWIGLKKNCYVSPLKIIDDLIDPWIITYDRCNILIISEYYVFLYIFVYWLNEGVSWSHSVKKKRYFN